MNLTEQQKDALAELINIAFGRAASSLSDLTEHRVMLDVPQVAIHPADDMYNLFSSLLYGEVATVHQIFTGPVAGNALLILSYESALSLVKLLSDKDKGSIHLESSDREALNEVGNILLGACLGTFGNLLQMHISFTVPRIHIESLSGLLSSLTIGSKDLQYALVVFTNFRLRDQAVAGHLVIILGVAALDYLLESVGKLG